MTTLRWVATAAFLAIPLLPSCYSDLKKKNEDLANQNRQLESELNQTKAERDEGRSREEILNKQLTSSRDEARTARDANSLKAQPQTPVEDSKPNNVAAKADKKSSGDISALAKKVSASISSTKAHVETKDGRVCITLPLGTNFGAGSAELDSQGKKTVHEIGKALGKDLAKDQKFFVVGHTDSDPPKKSKAKYPDNNALSYARAQAVVTELKASGIESKRMIVSGAGDSSPIAAGSSSKEKEKNRRVEIWLD
jgi:flagellar motor protein MotB